MKLDNENVDTLRRFLISHHEDGDDNSMYMKFCDIMKYVEHIEWQNDIQTRTFDLLCRKFKSED